MFQNKRVRYVRADELELLSSSATLTVKRRLLVHALSVDEHRHSPARMRYFMFVHYVQNYRYTPHRCCLLAAEIPRRL